jgi:hypothetical protein
MPLLSLALSLLLHEYNVPHHILYCCLLLLLYLITQSPFFFLREMSCSTNWSFVHEHIESCYSMIYFKIEVLLDLVSLMLICQCLIGYSLFQQPFFVLIKHLNFVLAAKCLFLGLPARAENIIRNIRPLNE